MAIDPVQLWQLDRRQLQLHQLEQFNRQLATILPKNKFYAEKLSSSGIDYERGLHSLDELIHWPLTTKAELSQSGLDHGLSQHHTYSFDEYSRLHRTSGTHGQPLTILDTKLDWDWWSINWQHVLQAAQVTSRDRVFLAFSFGPFIGFWSAHQACTDIGAMVIPGGGLSSLARLEFMRTTRATVVCCTPSYALHLAEVAERENFSLEQLQVRRLIVAGESGGSLPEVRQRINDHWRAEIVDHAGATEVGPWGFGWPDRCGLHVIESSFIAEVLPFESDSTTTSASSEDVGELVLTSLGRFGAPVIRYRTGDVVRFGSEGSSDRCNFLWLPKGVIGRVDDMITIRGVNIFPSSIDNVVRSLADIAEYQAMVSRIDELDQLQLELEAPADICGQIERALLLSTSLRIPVKPVSPGSLPRTEAKSTRWKDRRLKS